MQFSDFTDPNTLVYFGLTLVTLIVFYILVFRKQSEAMKKVKDSLKLQAHANRQLDMMVKELRRSNRFLAQLVELEYFDEPQEGQATNKPKQAQEAASEQPAVDSQLKLYVGNIDYTATEAELETCFSEYGEIEAVNIPVNRYTGRARGFGFVTFVSKEDAQKAMALDGTDFRGRQIQVNFAKERETD